MASVEYRTPRTSELNAAGEVFEKGAQVAIAFTVVKAVIDIFAHRSPLAVILRGAVLATGLKALSVASDRGVDFVNKQTNPRLAPHE